MNSEIQFSRRNFIIGSAAIGAGFALGFEIPAIAGNVKNPSAPLATPEIGVWVVIRPNDDVVVRIVKSEMGQGTITGLCQMVAEELECDWNKISYEYPTPGESLKRKQVWGSFSTGGSRGIRQSEQCVRKGGAAARMMLVQAAANEWQVPTAECFASNSIVTHRPTGRTVSYGKVAQAASRLAVPKDWKLIGKSIARIDDTAGKVTGKQIYGIDFKLPGMLIATINECPVFGGTLKSFGSSLNSL